MESAARVTWQKDVAPLVERSCLPCHSEGSGQKPTLDNEVDFLAHGAAALMAMETGWMPPFSVDRTGSCGDFSGPRPPNSEEIERVAAFLAGPETHGVGEPARGSIPLPRGQAHPVQLPSIEMPTQGDDHRCFVVPGEWPVGAALTGLGVERSEKSALHHLMLFSLPTATALGQAQALDDADPAPGFSCEGHPRVSGAELGAVWTPGQGVLKMPHETGVDLGTAGVVIQLHLHARGTTSTQEEVNVTLFVDDEVPTRIRPRPFAITGFSLPPQRESVVETRTFASPFGAETTVYGVFPHMHQVGSSLRLSVQDGGSKSCFAQSSTWRFDWQDTAFFKEPKTLGPQHDLTLQCRWDTRNRRETTRWGEGSEDEMCTIFLFVAD
jgi:hypothetical protein